MTITDADLERLLNLAAAEYAVPEDGIETVLAAEGAPVAPRVRSQRTWFAPRRLAVGFAALAIGGVFIGGVLTNGSGTKHSGGTALLAPAATGAEDMPKFAASAAAGGAGTSVGNGKYAPNVQAPVSAPTAVPGGTLHTGAGSVSGSAPRGGTAPDLAAPAAAAPPVDAAVGNLAPSAGGAGGAVKAADAGTSDAAKIVRTGQADLTVAKGSVPNAQDKLEGLATSLGGYVANEKSSGGDYPSASVTIRVPGDKFSELVKQVQTIGTVNGLSTQAADVTSQYTDLTARIHALETQRDTYLTLLAKASSIQETLAVQQRVDSVQTQLEQLQGQQKVLDDQTSYGSLAVTVAQVGQPVIETKIAAPRAGFSKAWYDAKHRFNGGVEGLVAASGPVAFIAVLTLVVSGVWLLVRRRLQRARV